MATVSAKRGTGRVTTMAKLPQRLSYEGSQDALFDSIWKFGGNLLPEDPLSMQRPQHTMNSVRD